MHRVVIDCRRAVFAVLALVAAACGDEPAARAAVGRAAQSAVRADTGSTTMPAAPRYEVVRVADAGRITGRVTATRVDRDTVIAVSAPPRVCGRTQRVALVDGRGDRVGGAIVWLGDAPRGKALPVVRRYDIEMRRCAVRPRIQTAIVGGMLDVRNRDAMTHLMRFLSGDSPLDSVEETDAGQVVPTAKVLARTGTVEVRCDGQALPCAWIRVFDQPYYTVTRSDGSFVLDSVPPGDYELDTWHPRLGTSRSTVHVTSGKTAAVQIRLSTP